MDAPRYERLWKAAATFRKVSPELEPLVRAVYSAILACDVNGTRTTLQSLLEHLASPRGRTDANCCVVDAFFSAQEQWEGNCNAMPAPLRNLLGDMGGALHDAIYAPQIARNFDSLPEQLLERLRSA
jgi:hypothetical protein